MTSPSPDPAFDSDAYDRAIRAERRKAERLEPVRTNNRLVDSDQARGYATAEELRRRKAADRAMTKKEGQR